MVVCSKPLARNRFKAVLSTRSRVSSPFGVFIDGLSKLSGFGDVFLNMFNFCSRARHAVNSIFEHVQFSRISSILAPRSRIVARDHFGLATECVSLSRRTAMHEVTRERESPRQNRDRIDACLRGTRLLRAVSVFARIFSENHPRKA